MKNYKFPKAIWAIMTIFSVCFANCICEGSVSITTKEKPSKKQDRKSRKFEMIHEVLADEGFLNIDKTKNQKEVLSNESILQEESKVNLDSGIEMPDEPILQDTFEKVKETLIEKVILPEEYYVEPIPEMIVKEVIAEPETIIEKPFEPIPELIPEIPSKHVCPATLDLCDPNTWIFKCMNKAPGGNCILECYVGNTLHNIKGILKWYVDKKVGNTYHIAPTCNGILELTTINNLDGAQGCDIDKTRKMAEACNKHPAIVYKSYTSTYKLSGTATNFYWAKYKGPDNQVKACTAAYNKPNFKFEVNLTYLNTLCKHRGITFTWAN